MKYILTIVLILACPSLLIGKSSDSILDSLKKSTSNRAHYVSQKEDRLLALRDQLINSHSPEEQYEIAKKLIFENSFYDNNSTLYYANFCLDLANKMNDRELIVEAKLNLADHMRYSGLIHESLNILESLDPDKLNIENKKEYYRTYMFVCVSYVALQNASLYRDEYKERAIRNADAYLALEIDDMADYMAVLARKAYIEKNYQQSLNTIKLLLKNDSLNPYQRAEYYSFLGMLYVEMDRNSSAEALNAFATSAILCNELTITKSLSLFYVAVLLIDTDHPCMDDAYGYFDIALENAQIFGDKYRRDFIKATYYSIQSLKLEKADMEQRSFKYIVAAILMVIMILTISLVVLWYNYVGLKKSREKLTEYNDCLRDSNRIKETYIKFFINRNSDSIELVNKHKKYLLKMLSMGLSNDKLRQEINATLDTEEDYNSLLADFDQSILELYPSFVNELNKLLKPESYFTIDPNAKHKLNTELRILALVRLGVDDNKQIASFLRITVQSVYNYRSKARGRAINEETFNESLTKLCI